MRTVRISVSDVIGGGICVSTTDGQRLYARIYEEVSAGNKVELSFRGVTRMTTAFLNAAVGQLYGEFEEGFIQEHLAGPVDVEAWHLNRLAMVVRRAKSFFRDQDGMNSVTNAVTGLDA